MRRRRGIGIPALVAVLIAIVAAVQVTQHFFTGQVVVQASRSLAGRAAWQVALSAVQEARSVVVARSARPGTREFKDFRGPAPAFGRRGVITIGPADLPDTMRLIKEVHAGSLELVSLRTTFEPSRLLIGAADPDHEGVLEIEAHVRSRVESVDRRVFRSWCYKTVHTAPGAELKDVVALIRAPDRVLKSRYDAHQIARTGIEQDLPTIIADTAKTVADARRELASATDPQLKRALEQLIETYAPLIEGPTGGSIGSLKNALDPRFRALAPLPMDPRAAVLVHRGTPVSPAEFDLQGDLDPLVTRYRQARDEAIRLSDRARATPRDGEAGLAAHRAYRDALLVLARSLAAEIERYLKFRETFTLVPPSEQPPLLTAYTRLDPVAKLPDFPSAPIFDLAMCVLLDPPKALPSPSESLALALRRLSGPRGFFGTLLIENGDTPLTLTGPQRGRMVLAVNGALAIENVTRADPSDQLTIVHATDPSKPLTLSGRIDATVVASGSRLTIRRGTTITGGLYLEDVDVSATIEPELTDPDRIAPDPARATIEDERLRQVVFSPWTRSLGSTRDR